MSDVIRMASHAYHHLVIFDRHTEIPLYLGRTRRTASAGQRIVLHAKDRGCSRPGCTVPGYQCQVHHVTDWAKGGLTDIDDLTLACGKDNRLVTENGWRTRKRKDGRTEWIPPPHLDSGQTRVNDYHHPERYLVEPTRIPSYRDGVNRRSRRLLVTTNTELKAIAAPAIMGLSSPTAANGSAATL